jgi:TP901 family phage tail tape measure protein
VNFVSSITLAFKDAFSSGFNDAKDSLAGMRGALDEIGQNQSMTRLAADMAMMTSMTDPMRKALSEAMDQPSRIAGSLDTSFRAIQVAAGASNEEMAAMRRELLAIGGSAVAGPEAVAGAFANVAGGIDDASKRMAVMNAAVALAEANQADLSMSTNAMVNVMNAWNLSADQASLAADIFTQTSLMGVGSLDEFAGSIGNISALAAGAGIGLDELGASFAYLSNKSIDAGQAQKQLKGIISTLVSPSESLSKLYESLGIESGKAMLQQYGLTESLYILKNAVGEDAFSGMIGSAEAANVALALTEDAYVSFAGSFAEGMGTVTDAARGVQLESIEAKMARLDSVSRSLQAQVGQDINGIKGFFIDFKFGFLSNVVSPLMSSPVGGALSKIAAGVGMGTKSLLDFGSGAMNTATQMATLTAHISNAGGISKMFTSSLGLMKSGFGMLMSPLKVAGSGLATFSASVKSVGFLQTFQTGLSGIGQGFASMGKGIVGALPKMGAWIASMWTAAAAHMAAFWPVYAIIAGVAALAAGVYLLIKHWDKVSGFFVGLWNSVKGAFSAAWDWIKNLIFGASDWVLGAVAIFFPIVGIPALIIKHWDAIKGFFGKLWSNVTSVTKAAWDGITGFFSGVVGKVQSAWNATTGFFSNLWSKNISNTKAAWEAMPGFFSGLWDKIKGGFSAAWDWIKNILFGTSDWILGAVAIFMPIVGIPALIIKHWDAIKDFFGGLWENIKSVFQGFIDWISGKVEAFTAPFKAIGDVVGGVFNKVGGFFTNLVGGGKQAGSDLNDAFATGIQSNATVPGEVFTTTVQTVSRQLPHSDAPEGPLSTLTASGRALTDTFASGMDASVLKQKSSLVFSQALPDVDFGAGTFTSGIGDIATNALSNSLAFRMDEADLREKALFAFPNVMPHGDATEFPSNELSAQGSGTQTINIQNMTLQAEDCETIFDFMRMIMHSVHRPEEAPV